MFQPLLGMLGCAGLATGLLSLAVAMGLLSDSSGAYQLWYSFANGFMYFLPIFLGYSGVLALPCFINPTGDMTDLINFIIAVVLGSAVAFVLTWIFYKDEPSEQPAE